MPVGYSERGFADYSDVIHDDHGSSIYVRESSQASVEGDPEGPWVWIYIDGEAIAREGAQLERVGQSATMTVKGFSGAHLSVEQATAIRDALTEFIEASRA